MDNSLLASIQAGKGLKKVDRTKIKDASAPLIDNKPASSGASFGGAPAPPTGNASSAGGPSMPSAPQLGGLFAGGVSVLRPCIYLVLMLAVDAYIEEDWQSRRFDHALFVVTLVA
jgi:hypothetical protein